MPTDAAGMVGMVGMGRLDWAVSWSKAGTGPAQLGSDQPKEGTGSGVATGLSVGGAGSRLDRLDFGAEVKVGARDLLNVSVVEAPATAALVPDPCT